MINISSFHKSKNNFRLIKRKSSNQKNMDGESFSGKYIAKMFSLKRFLVKLINFESEFFVRALRNQNQEYVLRKCVP